MPLKLSLKPNEKLIIGGAVVINGNTAAELTIENKIPILRQRDIMTPEQADSPCRRIYFLIQLMYVDEGNLVTHHKNYWGLVRDILQAAPSLMEIIDQINRKILAGDYYQALKLANKLIKREQELIQHAYKSS